MVYPKIILNLNTIHILNNKIANLNMEETIAMVKRIILNNQNINLADINAGKIIQINEDPSLKKSIDISDVIQADGQSVVWASKFLGKPLKERVAGIDLLEKLVALSYKEGFKIFFLGAKEDVVKAVVHKYTVEYHKSIIAGYRNGYFTKNEEATIATDIVNSKANILFVAITSPIQENFLYRNREILKAVNFKMGVGGSFDVISGKTKRAPKWMQSCGLEWFYRFLQEPKRMWKRYLIGNTKFIYLVLKEKFKKA